MTTVWPVGHLGAVLASALLLAACGRPTASEPATGPPAGRVVPTQSLTHSRAAPPWPPQGRCAALSGLLAEMVAAPDPAAAAARAGLADADGRVAVALQLATEDGDQVELARRYGLELRRRAGGWIEAQAPLTALCDLASDPQVRRVQAPGEPGATG